MSDTSSRSVSIQANSGTCGRCNTKLFRANHYETETWLGWRCITVVATAECPVCSVSITVRIPLEPEELT